MSNTVERIRMRCLNYEERRRKIRELRRVSIDEDIAKLRLRRSAGVAEAVDEQRF
jgi:hypothetical protein